MSKAAVDNDVLYKGAWYGLIKELLSVIPSEPEEAFVLGQSRFVVAKRIERHAKKGLHGASGALDRFLAVLADLKVIEPTPEEQLLAANLEDAAQRLGVPLDSGESLLCSVTISRGLMFLVTGDKRALAALEVVSNERDELAAICGRLLCLEQLFLRLLSVVDPAVIRRAVCENAHVDKALANCFSCSSLEIAVENATDGLASYIEDARRTAPRLLNHQS